MSSTRESSLWLAALLLLAQAYFLWMFFSTAALERVAAGQAIAPEVFRFAARWRHGMTGGFILYVPGFIAAAAATWLWSVGRPTRYLLAQGPMLMIAAMLVALLATPWGTNIVSADFARETKNSITFPMALPGLRSTLLGLYTLVAWTAVVLCCQRALAYRTFKPLWIPVVLDAILIVVRPFTFGDLVSFWVAKLQAVDTVAIFSVVTVVALSLLLVYSQLRFEARQNADKAPKRPS